MASCCKLTTNMTHDHENVSREVLSDVKKTIQIQEFSYNAMETTQN